MSKIIQTVEEIHNSNLYGIIIECGCSTAISSKIMSVSGSNKTLFKSEQPYSKEYQEEIYGEIKRSVSLDTVRKIIDVEFDKCKSDKVNFILATSWQLFDINNPLSYAHGWYGLYDIKLNKKYYFHFTVNRHLFKNYYNFLSKKENDDNSNFEDRAKVIDCIGDLGISLLHSLISGEITEIKCDNNLINNYFVLDIANDDNGFNHELLINTLEKSEKDYFLVFDSDGSIIRFEDFIRRSNTIIIQKGSFYPIHHGHMKMMLESLSTYKNSIGAFLISTYRYDKPHINFSELKDRISDINNAGFPLIICKSILFYENFDTISCWSYGKNYKFVIGLDTLNRIYQYDISNKNNINNIINIYKGEFEFLLFPRLGIERIKGTEIYNSMISEIEHNDDGISSTKIREGLMENKIEEYKK